MDTKQFELFKVKKLKPKFRLPGQEEIEMRGPEPTFITERVEKTREPHACARCGGSIPVDSSATRLIPKVKGKLDYTKVEYFHLKKDCPERT